MHEQMRKEKGLVPGPKKVENIKAGYQDMSAKQGDEKHLKITFAVIEKMHYSDFNSGNDAEDFKPSDIIDEEDGNLSDDEVLKKFKNDINFKNMGGKVGSMAMLGSSEFDPKVQSNVRRSKDTLNLDGNLNNRGLGLKNTLGKGSPRIPGSDSINAKNLETLKRGGGAPIQKGAPYLIDPLQEKIHTLKNQLQQQIGNIANRPGALQ